MAAPRRLTTVDDNTPVISDLDRGYDKFMQWYVMPEEEKRERNLPLTIKDFIEKHNLKVADIEDFRNNPKFNDDIEAYVAKWTYAKFPQLAHRLYNKAVKTLDPAILREFRAFGRDHADKKKAEKDGAGVNINFNLNVSDEQYRQIVAREAKILDGGGA